MLVNYRRASMSAPTQHKWKDSSAGFTALCRFKRFNIYGINLSILFYTVLYRTHVGGMFSLSDLIL